MPLPPELLEVPDETAVVGNIDIFLEYLTSGQAARDYEERLAQRLKELEALG